jgi:predicted DNA-binding mobile mystery protein A
VKNHSLERIRKHLDARLAPLKPVEQFAPPPRGWIKAVRQALGMSGVQFAKRLGVKPQTVSALEKSENGGSIQIETLRRAAEALDCTLVYALVPKTGLDNNIDQRAKRIAMTNLASAAHTMKLEAQTATNVDRERQIEEYVWKYVTERDVWNKS